MPKPQTFPTCCIPTTRATPSGQRLCDRSWLRFGFMETDPDNFQLEPGYESLFNGKDLTGWGFRPDSKGNGRTANFDGQQPVTMAATLPRTAA